VAVNGTLHAAVVVAVHRVVHLACAFRRDDHVTPVVQIYGMISHPAVLVLVIARSCPE
jgi:hypothetical protein